MTKRTSKYHELPVKINSESELYFEIIKDKPSRRITKSLILVKINKLGMYFIKVRTINVDNQAVILKISPTKELGQEDFVNRIPNKVIVWMNHPIFIPVNSKFAGVFLI